MKFPIFGAQQVVTDSLSHVYCSIFINCSANKGGGIYSGGEGTISVVSCTFHRCIATGESGRGAAVYVNKANSIFQGCCVDYSESGFGGDIQTNYVPIIRYINMQTFSGKMHNHPTYLYGINIEVKFSNSSKNNILNQETPYGNILCFASIQSLIAQYINGYQCKDVKSLFFFELCDHSEYTISHVNAIDNKHLSVVSFSRSNNVNVIFKDLCIISQNDYNHIYIDQSSSNNFAVSYINCKFSIDRKDGESVNYDECSFQQTMPIIHVFEQCYHQTIIKTCETHQSLMNYNFLISCIIITI